MNPQIQQSNRNLPGVPILPGRNTPLIQSGPPKNVKQKPDAGSQETEEPATKPTDH